MQPERLGPYVSTLNPGYDPSLPLYRPWPMFKAIHDANLKVDNSPWANRPPTRRLDPINKSRHGDCWLLA